MALVIHIDFGVCVVGVVSVLVFVWVISLVLVLVLGIVLVKVISVGASADQCQG